MCVDIFSRQSAFFGQSKSPLAGLQRWIQFVDSRHVPFENSLAVPLNPPNGKHFSLVQFSLLFCLCLTFDISIYKEKLITL